MPKWNLTLRALRETDAGAIAELANNKSIWNNVRDTMPYPYKKEDADFFINLKKNEFPQTTFVMVWNEHICGIIGLELQKDIYRKSAELGYWVGEPYWGMGIATQAVEKVVNYGFEELGMERIFAAVFEHNIGSMRVLAKNGFLKEGVFKKAVFKNREFIDEHRFGKLKS